MQDRAENNRRLVKNTFALYCRTAIVMLVSLFITRYLLKVFGEQDYGIYNVVASVVVLFSFLNASMTQSIQRFITFAMGRGDKTQLNKVFSMSFITQAIVIIILIILSEIIGVWFINYKLNIDFDRMYAANWAFQLSIVIFCVNMLRVPYESSVIAHEKISFFAYASIVDAFLKVLIVVFLTYSPIDKLIYYSLLLVVEALLMLYIYRLYCIKSFDTCRMRFVWDNKLFMELISFSGWSVCGSATSVATQNGFIFLINIFIGIVANAAMGIANQVSAAVNSFVLGFQTSFRPQIVKAYAQEDKPYLLNLVSKTSKFSFLLVFVPALFIIINAPLILGLWLGNVPEYTVSFCRLILICCVIDGISGPYNCAIIASGEIRNYQIAISVSFSLDLLFSWLLLKNGVSAHYILICRIITRGVLNLFIGLFYMKKQLDFGISKYFRDVLLPISIFVILIMPLSLIIISEFSGWKLLIISLVYSIITFLLSTIVVLNKGERAYIREFYKRKGDEI